MTAPPVYNSAVSPKFFLGLQARSLSGENGVTVLTGASADDRGNSYCLCVRRELQGQHEGYRASIERVDECSERNTAHKSRN